MATDPKISSLFNLPSSESSPLNDRTCCVFFATHLIKFYCKIKVSPSDRAWINQNELEIVRRALESFGSNHIRWHPKYGCALFLTSDVGSSSGEVAWNLLSLDVHRFYTKSKIISNGYQYVDGAEALDYEVLPIGICHMDQADSIHAKFQALLTAAQERTGDRRSAQGGKQGHQKTPSFMHALYREAFGHRQGQAPRGGFTDVGLHTGGQERDTAWPLVCAVLLQALCKYENEDQQQISAEYLFKKLIAYFGLYLSQETLCQFRQENKSAKQNPSASLLLDHTFRILQCACLKAAPISDEGVDMAPFLTMSTKMRNEIIKESSVLSSKFSEMFDLPTSVAEIRGDFSDYTLQLPMCSQTKTVPLSESKVHDLMKQNLAWIHFCGGDMDSLSNFSSTSTFHPNIDPMSSFIFLRAVENMLWGLSFDLENHFFGVNELESLASIIDKYRDIFYKLKSSGKSEPLIDVELNSREILVVWVGFCIFHSNAVRMHGATKKYGVALDYRNLSHLVLSTRREWDVVCNVTAYVNKFGTSNPIFSLDDENPSFDLGRHVARSSSLMLGIWKQECRDAESRIEGHWKEVDRKQKLAASLRSQIRDCEVEKAGVSSELASKKYELQGHEERKRRKNSRYASSSDISAYNSYSHILCTNSVNSLSSKVWSLERKISSLQSQVNSAIEAPTPVIQPLPSSENSALPIIFFLYMPLEYELLSRFSFTAQMLMLPKPWSSARGGDYETEAVNVHRQIKRGSQFSQYSWTDYYNRQQQSIYHKASSTRKGSDHSLMLRSQNKDPIPKQIGPNSVDDMRNKHDGVWYPDSMKPRMAWYGGPMSFDNPSRNEINPFTKVSHLSQVSYFTERLPKKAANLQWVMMQPGEKHILSSRGNRPYALQSSKPDWLSKSEFLSFANLRSYPNEQLRKVLVSIQDRALPFTEPAVQTLIHQALYHVGDIKIDNNGNPETVWKSDLYKCNAGRSAHEILKSFYEEIAESPKSYECVKLIGKLCNFFARWEKKCRNTARSLAKSVCGWADNLEESIGVSSPSLVPSIRSKQVVLYQQAILALGDGDLSQEDVGLLILMIVKCRNFFTEGNRLEEISANNGEIKYMLSQQSQLEKIRQCALTAPSLLTEALRSVAKRCPKYLNWKPWTPMHDTKTYCFHAKGKDEISYSINIISGDVLINGLPPSRLPVSILSHPLYKRTFGDRNHEVFNNGICLETARPVHNRFYRFFLDGSKLSIQEFKSDESEFLELLDGTDGNVESWAGDLPTRLKIMHSHWLFHEHGIVVVRGKLFNERQISFLIKLNNAKGGSTIGQVKSIEQHCKDRENLAISVQNFEKKDTLVRNQSKVLDILSKFEERDLIHSLVEAPLPKKSMFSTCNETRKLKLSFPRYDLSFEVIEDAIHCREIAGYHLSRNQQLGGTLKGVTKYLLLDQSNGEGKLLICPKGNVIRKQQGDISIQVNDDCSQPQMWYKYVLHPRFGYFEAKQSRASRMQLVALHIATSTSIPDEMLNMTGEERAISMIRHTWGNRPLNSDEIQALNNIKRLARGCSASLSILCRDIEMSSQQFSFLYGENEEKYSSDEHECFESAAYLNNKKHNELTRRCHLTNLEESRLLGLSARAPCLPPRFEPNQEILDCPINENQVYSVQENLVSLHSKIAQGSKCSVQAREPFPLDVKATSILESDMMEELKQSWGAYTDSKTSFSSCNASEMLNEIGRVKSSVISMREKAEDYALAALNKTPTTSSNWHDSAHDILRVAGFVPRATVSDLASVAIEKKNIITFNPMLSSKYVDKLYDSILIWLKLCVLEDKMNRITHLCSSSHDATSDIARELGVFTAWSAAEHPAWLVFEVEHRLQIRQDQYAVAKHLIENPGDVIQLNMGLGKTRVILPMLVMHWSMGKQNKIVRLNFLSALVEEAYGYLHNHLCASLLGIKIYTMPFCRDVVLGMQSISTMKKAMGEALDGCGVLVVAPEHRLSLELKCKELRRGGNENVAKALENFIFNDQWRDVLDECDEILNHRFQLIYAIGTPIGLPSGSHRWVAIQSLLTTLAVDTELNEFLIRHSKACNLTKDSTDKWPSIKFFEGSPLDTMLSELVPLLVQKLVENPPYELKWMLDHPQLDKVIGVLSNSEEDPLALEGILPESHYHDVLSLRGFLVRGLLSHCLVKRHRVNFGVARPGKKRLAIPFRFADTPSERSEFAHPDVALGLTVIAYYSDGLTKKQVRETMKSLLSLGENAQRHIYNSWFQLSSERMMSDKFDLDSMDCIEKVDMSNEVQFEKIWKYYRFNMHAINFYLNSVVFPSETEQFGFRLTANPWNLAHNPSNNVVGFSGTNDNHRILPLQVRQYFPWCDEQPDPILKNLFSTNGKMLDMIIKNTIDVLEMKKEVKGFKAILEVLKGGTNGVTPRALIDCGAVLAGTDLKVYSQTVLSNLSPEEFSGVLFYDGTTHNEWAILERSGRCLPKDISPIKEESTFVIFDEPRCRGTDLRLKQNAVALLTLAPNLCKDKLMQAAGRLRKLGRNQKLILMGGADVFSKLKDSSKDRGFLDMVFFKPNPKHVLSWAMENTVKSTSTGLSNWADQGLLFTTTHGKDPMLSIVEETLSLEEFYGQPFKEITVADGYEKMFHYHMNRTGGHRTLKCQERKIVECMGERIEQYGQDFTLSASGCDEECERELEKEIEKEKEVEIEVPLMDPMNEKVWDFKTVFLSMNPKALPVSVFNLKTFALRYLQPRILAHLNFSKKVFCTENFAKTVLCKDGSETSSLNSYLRLVSSILCFPNGELLLLSEYESNAILELFWDCNATNSKHHLLSLSLLRLALDRSSDIMLSTHCVKTPTTRLEAKKVVNDEEMASLQLFSGQSMYATEERKTSLKSILRMNEKLQTERKKYCPRVAAKNILAMRGLEKMFSYSDLESACVALLCEVPAPKY